MGQLTISGGTSVVVRQFMEILRGETPPHPPQNEFVTLAVRTETRYCLKCYINDDWDVWHGVHDGLKFKLGRCRCCGVEVTL